MDRLRMLSRLPHHVAEAADRMDELRIAGVYLPAQKPHEDFEGILIYVTAESPHRLDHAVTADGSSGISHEQLEQAVLPPGQVQNLLAARDAMARRIQLQI